VVARSDLRQADLFGRPLPLCCFCGYPKLPFGNFRCEFEEAKNSENFHPFLNDWHVSLDEEEKINEKFEVQIGEAINRFFETRPRLAARLETASIEAWAQGRAVKHRGRASQVSLISYLITGARRRSH